MVEIYNCKERFGYAYVWTCDRTMQNILSAYCEGRSHLWNLFFGWRKTRFINDEEEQMFFWVPFRKLKILIELADELEER